MENSLTLEDLVAVKSMIEVVSQRGAFHANELKPVGELYEKLSAFLETVTVQQNPAPDTTAQNTNQSQGETE
jgi:hypothetical protein